MQQNDLNINFDARTKRLIKCYSPHIQPDNAEIICIFPRCGVDGNRAHLFYYPEEDAVYTALDTFDSTDPLTDGYMRIWDESLQTYYNRYVTNLKNGDYAKFTCNHDMVWDCHLKIAAFLSRFVPELDVNNIILFTSKYIKAKGSNYTSND